jgi:LacI family transcriptional regulator
VVFRCPRKHLGHRDRRSTEPPNPPLKNEYVTIADIATRAGVTTATVSMCLANNPRISQATRDRVKAIAGELGYRPNPYVSALMRTRRTRRPPSNQPVLAMIGCFDTADGWRNTTATNIRQMREGAVERANARGYQAQDFWLFQDNMSHERFSQMLHTRSITGVIIGPIADNSEMPELKWENFSVVSLSTPSRNRAVTTVCNDHHLSSFRAVEEAHRLGYRRPGLVILESQHQRLLGRWESGFVMAQKMLPDIVRTEPLLVPDWSARDEILRWMKRDSPDVIITSSGEPIHHLLTAEGLSVPRDIGLVALGCRELGHPFSGLYQNGHLIGSTAADVLIGMIERNERGLPEQATAVMVESRWNAGQTLRAH